MTVDTRQWLDRYERLGMIVRALVSDISATEITEIVVQQGMAGLSASGAGICFVDGDEMYAVATVGSTAESVRRLPDRLPLSYPNPCCVAIRTGTEIWITDRALGLREFPHLAHASSRSQAWATLPLLNRGLAFGAVSLSFTATPRFDPAERQFIRALTDIAALALAPLHESRTGLEVTEPTDDVTTAILATSTDGLVVVDSGGTIIQCNARLCDMLGYDAAHLIGRSVEALLPPDHRPAHTNHRLRYIEDPVPRSIESGLDLVALRADGTEVAVEVSLSPCATRNGICTIAVIRPRT